MRRSAVLLVVIALIAACDSGEPNPDLDFAVSFVTPDKEVDLGKAFALTVVRVWNKDLEPDPWTDEILAPLVVKLEDTERRENSVRIEETRRYRAYAFDREAVVVAPKTLEARPRAHGSGRQLTTPEIRLTLKPLLDQKSAGPPELPPELLPERSRWPLWLAIATAVCAGVVVALRATRRQEEIAVAPAPIAPDVRALDRIRRLRERQPASSDEIQEWYIETAAIIRDFLAEQLGIRTLEMTSEEIVASVRLEPASTRLLAEVLGACDQVKFGRYESSPAERESLLWSAESFIGGTRGADSKGP